MLEPTIDQLDQNLTDAAVQTLVAAIACARAIFPHHEHEQTRMIHNKPKRGAND